MARDPLDSLLRLRRLTEDEAKRAFAASVAAETDARNLAEAAEADISREGKIAGDLAAGDGAVEAYAAWLPTGRSRVDVARAAHDRASANVVLARAALTLAHAAAEATTSFLDRRSASANAEMAKRSQAVLDEYGSRPAAKDGTETSA